MSSCWRISCRCCSLRHLFCERQVLLAAASGWSPPSRPQASLSHWTKWIWTGAKCKDIYHHPCNSYTSGICFALLQRASCCSSGRVNWSRSPAFPVCLRPGLWLWLEMPFFPVGMVSKCPITQEGGVNSHSGEKKKERRKKRKKIKDHRKKHYFSHNSAMHGRAGQKEFPVCSAASLKC